MVLPQSSEHVLPQSSKHVAMERRSTDTAVSADGPEERPSKNSSTIESSSILVAVVSVGAGTGLIEAPGAVASTTWGFVVQMAFAGAGATKAGTWWAPAGMARAAMPGAISALMHVAKRALLTMSAAGDNSLSSTCWAHAGLPRKPIQ